VRIVHGDKELAEKLGRNDLCPCGSNKCFQKMLHAIGPILTAPIGGITPDSLGAADAAASLAGR
jgi:SEC-C motif